MQNKRNLSTRSRSAKPSGERKGSSERTPTSGPGSLTGDILEVSVKSDSNRGKSAAELCNANTNSGGRVISNPNVESPSSTSPTLPFKSQFKKAIIEDANTNYECDDDLAAEKDSMVYP